MFQALGHLKHEGKNQNHQALQRPWDFQAKNVMSDVTDMEIELGEGRNKINGPFR